MTIHSHPAVPTTCGRCGEPVAGMSIDPNGWINLAPHKCKCKCDNEDPYVCGCQEILQPSLSKRTFMRYT